MGNMASELNKPTRSFSERKQSKTQILIKRHTQAFHL